MKLYNSLTRKIETFKPLQPNKVGMYMCGPTVYFYPHIGNWRTFTMGDVIVRALRFLGYDVHYVMNITDVGHLTGDNLGDADTGEDRLEKAAKREQKTAWDVAAFYARDFKAGYKKLDLTMPTLADGKKGFCVATDHIKDQIEMVKKIEQAGFTYRISDGVYFDVQKYEQAGNTYGRMSNIHKDDTQARVAENKEKKDQRDFALWKFSYPQGRDFDPQKDNQPQRRHMEWPSPWGLGFPGWHIECSAMSTKYLGDQFDIHLGGEDHKSTHHPNEIVQAEVATGKKPFVKYWLHVAFLKVNGGRMGKSLGNAYTLQDIEKKGFSPMHLRYFYLTGHYRKPLNFTWGNLEKAKQTMEKLVQLALELHEATGKPQSKIKQQPYHKEFAKALKQDLALPDALRVVWQMVRDAQLSPAEKYQLLIDFDQVLGLGLESNIKSQTSQEYSGQVSGVKIISRIPLNKKVIDQIDQRELARKNQDWQAADTMRQKVEDQGFVIEDTQRGPVVTQKP